MSEYRTEIINGGVYGDLYRPCIVDGQHKALFHRWSECSEVVRPSYVRCGRIPGGIIKYPCAIVEYEDGTVHEHSPSVIRFLDSENVFEDFRADFASDAAKVENDLSRM